MEQVDQYAGTASSLLVLFYYIIGALGMGLVSFDGTNTIVFIGAMASVTGVFLSFFWWRIKP